MKKISTVAIDGMQIFQENQLTIGLDLGHRTSHYCIFKVIPGRSQSLAVHLEAKLRIQVQRAPVDSTPHSL